MADPCWNVLSAREWFVIFAMRGLGTAYCAVFKKGSNPRDSELSVAGKLESWASWPTTTVLFQWRRSRSVSRRHISDAADWSSRILRDGRSHLVLGLQRRGSEAQEPCAVGHPPSARRGAEAGATAGILYVPDITEQDERLLRVLRGDL